MLHGAGMFIYIWTIFGVHVGKYSSTIVRIWAISEWSSVQNPSLIPLYWSSWWFGTCFIFHRLGSSSSQLTFIFFRGVDCQPPTTGSMIRYILGSVITGLTKKGKS